MNILRRECVRAPLNSTAKSDAITELVDMLDAAGNLRDRDAVLNAVLTRESTRSTGMELGLAVPHGKSHGLDTLTMAVGKPAEPMEFESMDGQPCRFIVLLASPIDKTGPHIQALAGVSRMWQDDSVRSAVLAARTSDELYEVIAATER